MSKMQDIQDWLRKYLFWCLCGLIAILSLTSWWLGVSTLTAKSKENLSKIDKNFKDATDVTAVVVDGNLHPNDSVNKQISDLTVATRKTVLATWKKLYDLQKDKIFKWPALLDQEFLTWINSHPADAEIPADQLVEYQNKVLKELERIVTQVANADWPDAVAAAAAAASTQGNPLAGPVRGRTGELSGAAGAALEQGVPGQSEKLLWDPADITAYKNRYKWTSRPITAEVRLAQEDLWLLEQLCQVITTVNGKTPPYQRPIKVVRKIAIEGFALDSSQPKGINSNRILRKGGAPAAGGTAGAESGGEATSGEGAGGEGAPAEGAPTVSPPPARLGGVAGGHSGRSEAAAPAAAEEGAAPAEGAAAARKPEDELYDWRYVDSRGYPLSKAQLDGDHKTDLYRIVPFKIQMHILQASLPKLLETIKNAPLTMEVTQLRINHENNAASQFAGQSKTIGGDGGLSGNTPNTANPTAGLLPGEIVLELHGVAYIATPYDENKLPPPESAAADPEAT